MQMFEVFPVFHPWLYAWVCLVQMQPDPSLQQWLLFYSQFPIAYGSLHLGKENPAQQPIVQAEQDGYVNEWINNKQVKTMEK